MNGFAILLGWAIIIGIWLFYHLTSADERRRWHLNLMPILGAFLFIAGVVQGCQAIFG